MEKLQTISKAVQLLSDGDTVMVELSRKFAKVEVSAWKEQQLVGKVFFTLQMM